MRFMSCSGNKTADSFDALVVGAASAALLAQYQAEAAKIPNLVVGGRLSAYKYFDMDKSIEAALSVSI